LTAFQKLGCEMCGILPTDYLHQIIGRREDAGRKCEQA